MSSDKDKTHDTEKKQYAKPELTIYGAISDLTKNITDKGIAMDNPAMKT